MSNYLEQPVLVTVKEVVFTKPGYGPGNTDHFLIVTTQDGAVANICIGAKSPIQVGASFVAEPKRSQKNGQSFGIALNHDDGSTTWWQAMARQQQGGGYSGGGNQRPATPAAPSGGSPAQRPAKRLTEGEAVELLKRLTAAGLEPSERVTILLATMRGEIDSPPQPQRLPMPAAKPMPQGYEPMQQQPDQEIPF